MAGHGNRGYRDVEAFPPVRERYCVKVGLASVVDDRTIRYHWPAIEARWEESEHTNLRAFCRTYHINYRKAVERPGINVTAKLDRLREHKRYAYQDAVIERLRMQHAAEITSIAERVTPILDRLEESTNAISTYLHASSTKILPDGSFIPNMGMRLKDAIAIAGALKACVQAASGILGIRQEIDDGSEAKIPTSRAAPFPVLAKLQLAKA